MPKYAEFDPAAAQPAPVIGWYDADFAAYPNLPVEARLLPVTPAQWVAHLADPSGWAVQGGVLVSYTPPVTHAQQVAAAHSAGLAITSTGTPALDGTYPTNGAGWSDLRDEALFIASFGAFSTGTATFPFTLPSGATVTFTAPAQLQAVVKAIGMYLTALKTAAAAGALPPATATIA